MSPRQVLGATRQAMNRTIAGDSAIVAAQCIDPNLGRLAYSVEELAAILGIGRTLAGTLVRSGRLPAVRVSGRMLIRRTQLIEWLEGIPTVYASSRSGVRVPLGGPTVQQSEPPERIRG
jgi:excisionase family DNA binding protein